jgi:SAM-dependent methyltransferase
MNTINFKENLKQYYDIEAGIRDCKSVKPDWKINVRNDFFQIIKQESKKTLLELGAGAGYDSLFFKDNGLIVIAIDLSAEMVKKCKEKNIETYELDYYKLSSLNKTFDCVYAINTLLHVPKDDLPFVLNEINRILNNDGLFYMGVYGGNDTENEYKKEEVSDVPRFFALHSEKYLKKLLEIHFKIIDFKKINFSKGTEKEIFYSIIMKKR